MKIASKIFFTALILSVSIIFFYWIKCQVGVDIIKNFTWEKSIPILNALQKQERIVEAKPGILLSATFDDLLPAIQWTNLWSRDKHTAFVQLAPQGINNSTCLQIKNISINDWAYSQNTLYIVNTGDLFLLQAWAKVDGNASAQISVTLYDNQRNVINWNYAPIIIKNVNLTLVRGSFKIPTNVKFLRLKLTGFGLGNAYFDNIIFEKK